MEFKREQFPIIDDAFIIISSYLSEEMTLSLLNLYSFNSTVLDRLNLVLHFKDCKTLNEFPYKSSVTGLHISWYHETTTTFLVMMKSFPRLHKIVHNYKQGNNNGIMNAIVKLDQLTELDLGDNNDYSKFNFSGLTRLKTLKLKNDRFNFPDSISTLTNLTYLDIFTYSFADVTNHISGLTNLTYLDMSKTQCTNINGLSTLSKLTHLKVYDITAVPDFPHLTHLEFSPSNTKRKISLVKLKTLTSLKVDGRNGNINIHTILTPTLRELNLYRVGVFGSCALSDSNIESLTLHGCRTDDSLVRWLANMPHLTTLILKGNRGGISQAGHKAILRFAHLINFETDEDGPNQTNLDLEFFESKLVQPENSHLENLRFVSGDIVNLNYISNFTSLTTLSAYYNKDTESPDFLSKLVNLTSLKLGNCTNAVCAHLPKLTKLQRLDLTYSNDITSAAMQYIDQLPNLAIKSIPIRKEKREDPDDITLA